MLIEVGAIKIGQTVGILRKVGRNPIQNDANAMLMTTVHKGHEIFRRAKSAGGRKIPNGLIAPGSVKRMFRDGKQFNVGIPHFEDVRNELLCQLEVGQITMVFARDSHPGAQMDFIDGQRAVQPALAATLL